MNSTLVVFASKQEFNLVYPQKSAVVASSTPLTIGSFNVAVCGVGLLEFATNLAYQLSQRKYARVIMVGVCGAYPGRELEIGDVVRVETEVVGDMGVQERDGHFLPWGEVSGEPHVYAGESPRELPLQLAAMRSVAGVSVNCCTGTVYLAQRRCALFDADIETMEGASFFAVCKRFGVSGYQFRAVSNIATDRDTSTWRIPEAMAALKERVLDNL